MYRKRVRKADHTNPENHALCTQPKRKGLPRASKITLFGMKLILVVIDSHSDKNC